MGHLSDHAKWLRADHKRRGLSGPLGNARGGRRSVERSAGAGWPRVLAGRHKPRRSKPNRHDTRHPPQAVYRHLSSGFGGPSWRKARDLGSTPFNCRCDWRRGSVAHHFRFISLTVPARPLGHEHRPERPPRKALGHVERRGLADGAQGSVSGRAIDAVGPAIAQRRA